LLATDVATAILCLLPQLSPAVAERHGAVIAFAAHDEAEAAALVVTGYRETGFEWLYENCSKLGDGGMGTYGLGVGYGADACASPERQVRGALLALHNGGFPERPRRAFARYLGSSERWPEARERLSLWVVTAERIKCSCSL
jgi:hypothetical protein